MELGSVQDSTHPAGGSIIVSGSEGDLIEKVEYRYLDEPKPTAPLPAVTMDAPFVNSLGMKFVSVPGTDILICIHETRRTDYSAFADAVPGVDMTWKNLVVEGKPLVQDDDHPVVGVSWEDASAFCAWLSQKEGRTYRLPTDAEWNRAVVFDVDDPSSTSDTAIAEKLKEQFPWGDASEEDSSKYANYHHSPDGYIDTAPVMSFLPNHLGIYDLGGNAWELCGRNDNELHLRGCGYRNFGGFRRSTTKSSVDADFRIPSPGDNTRGAPGFRCVVEISAEVIANAKSAKPSSTPSPKTPEPAVPPTTPPPAPKDDVAQRLAQLAAQFQEAYDRDILPGHQVAVDDLDQKYLAAIARAMNSATKGAKLAEAVQLRDESTRVKDKKPLPETDPDDLPKSLKNLRTTYREALGKLEAERNTNAKPYYDRYDALLNAYQTELTQQRRLDDAVRVKTVRAELAKARSSFSVAPPSPQ